MRLCPILMQNIEPAEEKQRFTKEMARAMTPRRAECLGHGCVAFDDLTKTCKHYNQKVY